MNKNEAETPIALKTCRYGGNLSRRSRLLEQCLWRRRLV